MERPERRCKFKKSFYVLCVIGVMLSLVGFASVYIDKTYQQKEAALEEGADYAIVKKVVDDKYVEMRKLADLWRERYGDDYIADSELEVDGVVYENMWEYIVKNVAPKFYCDRSCVDDAETRIDNYVITGI